MNEKDMFLFILVVFAFAFATIIPWREVSVGPRADYLDLYYAEAPFGILYSDTSGHVGGNFLWTSGSVSTKLGESYVVKYWVGDELRSMTLPASLTPIVVDGSFKLELDSQQFYQDVFVRMPWSPSFNSSVLYSSKDLSYRLHLPSLPQNVSGVDWGIVP